MAHYLGGEVVKAGSYWNPARWEIVTAKKRGTLRVIGAVVTVPIAEELAFRGYLMRRLIAAEFEAVPLRQFSWLGFCGSSLVFGAMHQRLLAGTLAGGVYALVLLRRGELSDDIVAHATTNALLAEYVLTTGSWSLWG
jgi:CAAX prenyl protease-like protein